VACSDVVNKNSNSTMWEGRQAEKLLASQEGFCSKDFSYKAFFGGGAL